jgi:UDP-3-O-[3-hydroxymyristoyl] glucosamine N-acyltransferase
VATLTLEHADASGASSIMFKSPSTTSNGDYAYIKYQDLSGATTNAGLLTIGIENNPTATTTRDRISLYAAGGSGFIGLNTLDPSFNLDVSGNAHVSSSLFVNTINPSSAGSTLNIASTQTNGIINIATEGTRTGHINIGNQASTNTIRLGNFDICNNSIRGRSGQATTVFSSYNLTGGLRIGESMTGGIHQYSFNTTSGSVQIAGSSRGSGNIEIGCGNNGPTHTMSIGTGETNAGKLNIANGALSTGSINILDGSGSTGTAIIGRNNAIRIVNSATTTVDVSATGVLTLRGSNLNVIGATLFNSDVSLNQNTRLGAGNNSVAINKDISSQYSLDVSGTTNLIGPLYTLGDVSLGQKLFVSGDVSVNTNLYIGRDVSINGNLYVANSVFLLNSDVSTNQNLYVAGRATFGRPPTSGTTYELDVSGQMRIYEQTGSNVTSNTSVATLTLEHADASGASSIMFKSPSTASNGDYAYIKYQDLSGTTTNAGLLTIGVENDPTAATTRDRISLYAAGGSGFIGINILDPSFNLDVSGNANVSNTLFVNTIDPSNSASVMNIATTQTGGILNIGTGVRTSGPAAVNINNNGSSSGNTNIGGGSINITGTGNLTLTTTYGTAPSINIATSSRNGGTFNLGTGDPSGALTNVFSGNATNNAVLNIATGSRTAGSDINIATNTTSAETLNIGTGQNRTGTINMGTGNSGNKTIGIGGTLTTVNITGKSTTFTSDVSLNQNTRLGAGTNSVSINKDISSNFALDVSGATNFRGVISTLSDISVNGRLFTSGDVSLNQKLFVNGDASFNTNLLVGRDLSVNRFLYAANNALFNTDVSINQNLYVSGKMNLGRPPTNTAYEFDVSGQMRIYETVGTSASASSGSLTLEHGDASGVSSIVFRSRNNNASDYGYLQYQENIGVGGISEKGLLTLGIENEAGAVAASDRISLYSAGGNGFVGVNTKDPAYHLDVSGNMSVTGNTILTFDVSMNRNAKIGAGSNSVSINKDISSNFALDISGATNFRGIISTLSDISVNGRLFTSGDVSLNQKLFVRNDASLNQNLYIGQDLSVNRFLYVASKTVLNSDASLNQNVKLGSGNNAISINKDTNSAYALDISGTTNISNGPLFVSAGDVSLNSKLFVQGDASLNRNLYIGQDVSINRSLYVANAALFNSDISTNQNLYVAGKATFGRPPATGTYELDMSGQMRIYEKIGSNVISNTSVATLTLEHGDASGCSSIMFKSPSTTSNGDYAYIKYQDLSGTTTNNGLLTIGVENDPTVAATADKISLYAAGGSGYVGVNTLNPTFNFDVCGNARFSGNVTANTFVAHTTTVAANIFGNSTGNITFGGVIGSSNTISIASSTSTGNVRIGGNIKLGYGISYVGVNKDPSAGFLFDVSGDSLFRNRLFVNSDASFGTNVNVVGDVSVNRYLYVTNRALFSNDVSINGNTRFSKSLGINTDPLTQYALDISGTTNLRGPLFASVDVSLNNKLFVSNDVSINTNLYVGQDVSINRNFYVANQTVLTNDVSMNRNVDIGTGNNSVSINKDISSQYALDISGETNMRGNLSLVGGNVIVNGTVLSTAGTGTSLTTQGVKVGTDTNYYVTVDKANFYNDPSLVIYYNFDTSVNGYKIENMAATGSTFDGSFNVSGLSTTTGMIDTTTKIFGTASLKNNPTSPISNAGVYVPNASSIPISTTMTFSMWVNKLGTPIAGTFDRIFEYTDNTSGSGNDNNSIAIDISSSGILIPVLTSGSDTCFGTLTSPILSYNICDGSWNHIVWTITPSTSYIYINGSIKHYDSITTAVPTTSRQRAYIAFSQINVDTRDFSGNIDDYRYYSGKALNQAEIYQLYNNTFFNLDICGGFLANGSSVIFEPIGSKATANSGTLTLIHGDASGASSIMFKSVNDPLEYGYIQYEENTAGSTGYHYGLMTIGIENDSGAGAYTAQADRVSLFPSGGQGFVGVNTKTPYYSLDVSGNFRVNNSVAINKDISSQYALDVSGTMRILEGAGTSAAPTAGSLILEHTAVGGTSSIMFKGPNTSTSDYAYVQYTDASSVVQSLLKYDLSSGTDGAAVGNTTFTSTGTNSATLATQPTDNSFAWVAGTPINGITPVVCISFNQTNLNLTNTTSRINYLQVGSPSNMSSFTFSVWIRPGQIAASDNSATPLAWMIANLSNSSSNGSIDIWLENNGRIYVLLGDDNSNYIRTNSTLVVGTWYHLVFTFDGNLRNGFLYLNGVLDNQVQGTTGLSNKTLKQNNALLIGLKWGWNTGTGSSDMYGAGMTKFKGFRGQMAFINVFDVGISASDVLYLYNNPAYNVATNPERGMLTIGVENDTGVINNDRIVLWPGAGTGNIGINTKTPSTTLDISGTVRIYEGAGTTASTGAGSLILEHTAVGGTSSIMFKGPNTTTSDYAYVQYTDDSSVVQSFLKYDLSINSPTTLTGLATLASTGTNSTNTTFYPTDNSFAWFDYQTSGLGAINGVVTPQYCISFNQANVTTGINISPQRINYLETAYTFGSAADITFSVWVRPAGIDIGQSTPGRYVIFYAAQSSTSGTGVIEIWIETNSDTSKKGKVYCSINADQTNRQVSGLTINLDAWNHVALSFSSTNKNGQLYLNNVPASNEGTGFSGKVLNYFDKFWIGNNYYGNGLNTFLRGFRGLMAFVNIFDKTLSESDVAYLYNNPAYNVTTNPERGLLTIGVENDTGVINNDRIVLWPGAGTGNVGINTRTPTATLDVSGSINTNGNASVSGNLTVSGNVSATSYNATSDYRIKTGVMPLDLNFTVDGLNPVSYVLKDDKEAKKQIGFIAHEVQELYPFLVNGVKDGPNTQSINYSGFIGILTKEIKDLKAKVQEQEERFTLQEERFTLQEERFIEQEERFIEQEERNIKQETRLEAMEKLLLNK